MVDIYQYPLVYRKFLALLSLISFSYMKHMFYEFTDLIIRLKLIKNEEKDL